MRLRGWGALVLLGVFIAGCASDTKQTYMRDGVEYGVTDGRFRGRWWNHYERGSSFIDGRFYAEAEADMRTAIAQRAEDQRWARTYGLHFIPEYFPNRELGIALFGQGRVEEAIRYLENSLDQTYSARAAYYLDEARKAWVEQAGVDAEDPAIALRSPDLSAPLAASQIRVVAAAMDDTFVRTVRVNGEKIPIDVSAPAVEFETEIRLHPGQNGFEIEATDIAGNTTVQRFAFVADLDGPAVSFDGPVRLPGTIRGVAYDPAGVRALSIAGVPADLSAQGEVTAFTVSVNRDQMASPLLFKCSDALGNHTRGRVPLESLTTAETTPDLALAHTRSVRISDTLTAEFAGEVPVALHLAQAELDGPVAEFANVEEGQRYLMEEIVVTLKLASNEPVVRATLNGAEIDGLVPGRREQRISRRVRLDQEGPNGIEVQLEDASGRIATAHSTVVRELTDIEKIDNRLSVAILGNVWTGANPQQEGEAQFILDEFTSAIYERDRFQLVTRDELPEIVQERELIAALGDEGARAALGSIVPSEVLVIGKIRRGLGSIEIILQAIEPQSTRIIGYADVAGPGDTVDDLEQLAHDLAVRFEQEFPRVQGEVIETRSATRIATNLTQLDGLRAQLKCIIFRHGEPIVDPGTGQVLGRPVEIVGQGFFEQVDDELSLVALAGEDGAPAISASDLVILK